MDADEPVRSAHNAKLKAVRGLRAGRERDGVLLEGRHLLEEALAAGVPLAWVLYREDAAAEPALAGLLRRAHAAGAEVRACAPALLREVSELDAPAEVLGWAERRHADWRALLAEAAPGDWGMVAAGVQDPGNLGALVRVAAGFGACVFVALRGGGSPWHPRALRGASGTTWRLPVAERVDAEELVQAAHDAGVALWGLEARGDPLDRALRARRAEAPVLLVAGGEGAGIPPLLHDACARRIAIPLERGVESLNVAAAAAVAAWALRDGPA